MPVGSAQSPISSWEGVFLSRQEAKPRGVQEFERVMWLGLVLLSDLNPRYQEPKEHLFRPSKLPESWFFRSSLLEGLHSTCPRSLLAEISLAHSFVKHFVLSLGAQWPVQHWITHTSTKYIDLHWNDRKTTLKSVHEPSDRQKTAACQLMQKWVKNRPCVGEGEVLGDINCPVWWQEGAVLCCRATGSKSRLRSPETIVSLFCASVTPCLRLGKRVLSCGFVLKS